MKHMAPCSAPAACARSVPSRLPSPHAHGSPPASVALPPGRPEICRTYNFGDIGSSSGQYFRLFLKPIRLNNGEAARSSAGWHLHGMPLC